MPLHRILTRTTLALAVVSCHALAAAAPTLSLLDLGSGVRFLDVAQRGAALAAGGGLMAHSTRSGDLFAASVGERRDGVIGMGANGGLGFAATDAIGSPPSVDSAAAQPLGLSRRGGVTESAGFLVGVNGQGGLTYVESGSDAPFTTSSVGGLFSRGSSLLNFDVGAGRRLFGQVSALGSGTARGVLGTTDDGRLRLLRTDGPQTGAVAMVSRPLGFAADTGLALFDGFVVGVNDQGRVNLYEPLLDLLFTDIGPAGLFSAMGGMAALDFGSFVRRDLFDLEGDVLDSRGVLGISATGSLAYLRLDVIPGDRATAAHAFLRNDVGLNLDLDSGLVLDNGFVTAMSAAAPVQTVPEPGTAMLVIAAAGGLACRRQARAH
jgi:hypothetical protein